MNHQALSSFIWSVADLLRGDYKQSEYGKVILPFTVLRRLDCVLEPTKAAVLAENCRANEGRAEPRAVPAAQGRAELLQHLAAGHEEAHGRPGPHRREPAAPTSRRSRPPCATSSSVSTSTPRSTGSPSPACSIWSRRSSPTSTCIPTRSATAEMGAVFEELIRKFAELSNETAGEHFTPREVIRLMVNLLFIEDDDALTKPGVVRTIYDPTAGTGGMLSVAGEHLAEHEPRCPARHVRAGAEPRILRHLQGRHAHQGPGRRQHHLRQHPLRRRPRQRKTSTTCSPIRRSAWSGRRSRRRSARSTRRRVSTAASAPACRASVGRLAAVPAAPDLQDAAGQGRRQPVRHRPQRLAAVHRRRGLGESEIRRYVLENDLVEAIIGLPTDMFYNTGICTYVWIVSQPQAGRAQGQGAAD